MATFVPADQVLNENVVIFATGSSAFLSLLCSNIHVEWAWKYSAKLRTDLQYGPSNCFEPFPQPTEIEMMIQKGKLLDSHRQGVLALRSERNPGLTALYDLVNDEAIHDKDIVRLREIHVEIDEAVREAYALDEERESGIREYEAKIASAPLPSWREIDLGHGFHETRQGVRFTICPQAQTDVLDKLLALNHYRYRQEQEQGVTRKKRRGARAKPAAVPGAETTLPIEDALIPRDDTLF